MVLSTISCGSVQSLSRICGQPVTCKLLVEGWLSMSWFITVCRPETGAVRCQHFITDYHISVFIQTELEFGVSNDDTFAQCVFCTFLIQEQSCCHEACSAIFLTFAREIFLQVIYALLEGNVLIVVTDLGLGGRGVDWFRKLVGFF